MSVGDYRKIGTIRSAAAFRDYLGELGISLPCDNEPILGADSPMAQPIEVYGRRIGNRWAVQPMEGWDGTADGFPTERTRRRWRRFGLSGAKLVWGGEAVAVCHQGRANPNQLVLNDETAAGISDLRRVLVEGHVEAMGSADGLLIGLQLTHSGRFCRPNRKDRVEPKIAYHHPLLDRRVGISAGDPILSDDELGKIVQAFVEAAELAHQCGFDFVDIKHCHGYLGHELLSAVVRPGAYGGSLENRTRFLREVVRGVREEAPGLEIGVRLSAFDVVPYVPDATQSSPGKLGPGTYENFCDCMPYVYGFGVDRDQPTEPDLAETFELVEVLRGLGISLINITAGSPYYNPHIQRPAFYPPSDGYQPPEDPLIGVARQIYATRYLKQMFPEMVFVGSAYSYLQEYLPHVAQALVRDRCVDFVGLGRMMLAYPELPADLMLGRPLRSKVFCRTFSDCTTAPRNGIPSGCYPLDPFYKSSEEARSLADVKKSANAAQVSGELP